MEIVKENTVNSLNNKTYANNSNQEKSESGSFSQILQQSKDRTVHYKKPQDDVDETQRLRDDIKSLFKTGLTVTELEQLEKYLEELIEKIKKQAASNDTDTKDIESMFDAIEQAILKLQKRVKGQAVKESKNDDNEISQGTGDGMLGFKNRIKKAQEAIEDLKKGINEKKESSSYNEQLRVQYEMRKKIQIQ